MERMEGNVMDGADRQQPEQGFLGSVIRKYAAEDTVVFVFPSEITAGMWQEEALDFHPGRILPDERFIAWDRFKSIQTKQAQTDKSRAETTDLIRSWYAGNLAARNARAAAEGQPLFRAVIPPRFAAHSAGFRDWIAGILPQLDAWRRRYGDPANGADAEEKAEAADLDFIRQDYLRFLQRHNLAESGWLRQCSGGGKKYLILFPETIEDFAHYAPLLRAGQLTGNPAHFPDAEALGDFSAVCAPPFPCADYGFRRFDNFREEHRQIALGIERLLMQGVKPEHIAVSLANPEENAPYFMRELAIRGIPSVLRAGYVLGEGRAGKIFSRIQECVSENFSFRSMKRLLTLKTICWQTPDLPEKLIAFGIQNHCVSSWYEQNRFSDVWENAFRLDGEKTDARLEPWYKKLKTALRAMGAAKSFSALRTAWFMFRDSFLDTAAMREENNRETARCLEELSALIEMERCYGEYAPPDPLPFFLSRLQKKIYVPAGPRGGVSVFPYRVAAGTPFRFHFAAGMTQEDATVLYTRFGFLRKDKRMLLAGCGNTEQMESDASRAFFSLYLCGTPDGGNRGVFFSAAQRDAGGYKTVHNAFFADMQDEAKRGDAAWPRIPDDPFICEEQQKIPTRIYPLQKAGYGFYTAQAESREQKFSFLKQPFGSGNPSAPGIPENLLRRLSGKQKNKNGIAIITATDLKTFAECPAQWFLGKILSVEPGVFSAELIDERQLGLIFHEVLKNLYRFIRETDGCFLAAHAELYKSRIIPLAEDAAKNSREFRGPLTASILSTLTGRIQEGVQAVVDADCEILNGFIPQLLEEKISVQTADMEFRGTVDRISCDSGKTSNVIIDYKSGKYPKKADYKITEEDTMADFQLPLYVFLAEHAPAFSGETAKITQAWIFSIREKKYYPVLHDESDQKLQSFFSEKRIQMFRSKEEFTPVIEAMLREANRFRDAIHTADFRPRGFQWEVCAGCSYKNICRRTYAVGTK